MKQMLLTYSGDLRLRLAGQVAGRWKFILVLQVSLSRSRIIKSEGPQMQIHIENKCRSILQIVESLSLLKFKISLYLLVIFFIGMLMFLIFSLRFSHFTLCLKVNIYLPEKIVQSTSNFPTIPTSSPCFKVEYLLYIILSTVYCISKIHKKYTLDIQSLY